MILIINEVKKFVPVIQGPGSATGD